METEERIEVRRAGWIGEVRVNGQIWLQTAQRSVSVRRLFVFDSSLAATYDSRENKINMYQST